jgi:hypothetical protein
VHRAFSCRGRPGPRSDGRENGQGTADRSENISNVTDALLAGRTPAKLQPAQAAVISDALFEADRVDGQKFEGVHFEHCTFANVSFKDAGLTSCTFENCAFLECYFRRTQLDSSRFLGCKFVSCDFPKTSFRQCSFVYSTFRDCYVPYREFEPSLPVEANLRRLLAENLAREAESAGASGDARLYRLQGFRAHEEYLRRGALGSDEWSREHFPSLPDRFFAGIRLVSRWINRFVWGYGDRGIVLVRNAIVLVFGLFPLLYYLTRSGLSQAGGAICAGSYFFLSADAFLNNTGFSGVSGTTSLTRFLIGFELASGFVFLGLAVTLLFRWITRR